LIISPSLASKPVRLFGDISANKEESEGQTLTKSPPGPNLHNGSKRSLLSSSILMALASTKF
jgi:hypothetical protein